MPRTNERSFRFCFKRVYLRRTVNLQTQTMTTTFEYGTHTRTKNNHHQLNNWKEKWTSFFVQTQTSVSSSFRLATLVTNEYRCLVLLDPCRSNKHFFLLEWRRSRGARGGSVQIASWRVQTLENSSSVCRCAYFQSEKRRGRSVIESMKYLWSFELQRGDRAPERFFQMHIGTRIENICNENVFCKLL